MPDPELADCQDRTAPCILGCFRAEPINLQDAARLAPDAESWLLGPTSVPCLLTATRLCLPRQFMGLLPTDFQVSGTPICFCSFRERPARGAGAPMPRHPDLRISPHDAFAGSRTQELVVRGPPPQPLGQTEASHAYVYVFSRTPDRPTDRPSRILAQVLWSCRNGLSLRSSPLLAAGRRPAHWESVAPRSPFEMRRCEDARRGTSECNRVSLFSRGPSENTPPATQRSNFDEAASYPRSLLWKSSQTGSWRATWAERAPRMRALCACPGCVP